MSKRPLSTYRLALDAIRRAQTAESLHGRSYGGHRHMGPNHPLTGRPTRRRKK